MAGQLAANVVADGEVKLVDVAGKGVCTCGVVMAGLVRPYRSGTSGTTPGAGVDGVGPRNGFCAADCDARVVVFVTAADPTPAWLVFADAGCVDGGVIEDESGGTADCDAPGAAVVGLVVLFSETGVSGAEFSFEALAVFAGTSLVSDVAGVVAVPGRGGSSGRPRFAGTVAKV